MNKMKINKSPPKMVHLKRANQQEPIGLFILYNIALFSLFTKMFIFHLFSEQKPIELYEFLVESELQHYYNAMK